MRVHLVGLVHRDANPDWEPDAYVGKLWRLARMLAATGHEVFVYGGPNSDTAGTDVTVVTADDRARWFGDEDWADTVFNTFDPGSAPWMAMNSRVAVAIAERIGPLDIIGLTMGASQAAIQQAFPHHVVCEVGVGYSGVLGNTPRCFESEAWRHFIYGQSGADPDGRYFDTVIPNAFDSDDYHLATKDDYLLFLGRLTERKGLEVVRHLAERYRVVTAGQGEPLEGVEHLGVVRGKEKAALLAGARAVLCPSVYVEPFGGVAVEAMLSGTPVIASPFGAFSETVVEGMSGWRCHTLAEFAAAAEQAFTLDHYSAVSFRQFAMRYSLDAVAPRYGQWLDRLQTLYGAGWYA